ncbi:MAG: YtxH domain-containing protein [bacterium]|nr:YtxH domain-containing protein [bacterium]
MDESARNENGFAKGFLVGILLGVILTFLLTTKKGQKILSFLKGRGSKFLDELGGIAKDVRENIEEKAEEGKVGEKVTELVTEMQERGRAVAKTALKKVPRPTAPKRRTFIRRK